MTRSQKQKESRKEPFRFIQRILTQQVVSSKERGHNPPDYNYEQLEEYLLTQTNFGELMLFWRLHGYKKNMRPSIDRLDNKKGYSFGNIRVVTWDDNNNAPTGRNKKRVILEKEGTTWEFESAREAAIELGLTSTSITKACTGVLKSTGGYKCYRV